MIVQITAKGRTQRGRMRAQILRTNATGGVKKCRKALRRTPVSGQNKTRMYLNFYVLPETSIKTSVR